MSRDLDASKGCAAGILLGLGLWATIAAWWLNSVPLVIVAALLFVLAMLIGG